MRNFVQLMCTCLLVSLGTYAQVNDSSEAIKFYSDSSLFDNLNLLTKFDSTDRFSLLDCESSAEIVADIYFHRSEYRKAIAYYDSADSKYRNKAVFCGNGYFIYMIPRRYKSALAYIELERPDMAIKELTPYMFDDFSQKYIDSSMLETYIATVRACYSRGKLKAEIKLSLDNAEFVHFYSDTIKMKPTSLNINFKVRLFQVNIVTADFKTNVDSEQRNPQNYTKEYYIGKIKRTKAYQALSD